MSPSDQPKSPRDIGLKGCASVSLVLFALMIASSIEPALLHVPFLLLFGWVNYLMRTLPEVTWNWEAIASGAAFLGLSVAGFHLVAHGIARSRGSAWRWKWSFCFTLLFSLVFGVSLVASGFVHQVDRLSKEPKFRSRQYESMREINEVQNLISAVKNFSADYARYPARLEELLTPGLIDPSGNWEAMLTQTPREANELPAPWIYVRGLSESAPGNLPLIIAPRPIGDRHIVGNNDGSVALIRVSEIRTMLPSLREGYASIGLPLPPVFAQYDEDPEKH